MIENEETRKEYQTYMAVIKQLLHVGDYSRVANVVGVTRTTVANAMKRESISEMTDTEWECIKALNDIACERKKERMQFGELIAKLKA